MQSIGEKLEEARKRRGISIREASEVTKIRGDYLGSFENNSFDLNIPEVYIRGFLRAYANFLKLNSDKVITDYNAHQLGESAFVRQKESREFLGRMDIPDEHAQAPQPAQAAAPAARNNQPSPQAPNGEGGFEYNNFDKASLIKGGVAIAGAGLLVAVILFVVFTIFRSGPDETLTAQGTAANAAAAQELTLIANGGDILSITVTEVSSGRELYRGPLNQGDKQRVPFDQQVEMRCSNVEYLGLEDNGRAIRTTEARGPGRIFYPQDRGR